jgi:hypothetical protein
VAEAVGVENVLPAEIVSRAAGLLRLRVGGTALECLDGGESGPVLASIRAEDVALSRDAAPPPPSATDCRAWCARFRSKARWRAWKSIAAFRLVALVTAQSAADLNLLPGESLDRHRQDYVGTPDRGRIASPTSRTNRARVPRCLCRQALW